jgi:hypothetical protein
VGYTFLVGTYYNNRFLYPIRLVRPVFAVLWVPEKVFDDGPECQYPFSQIGNTFHDDEFRSLGNSEPLTHGDGCHICPMRTVGNGVIFVRTLSSLSRIPSLQNASDSITGKLLATVFLVFNIVGNPSVEDVNVCARC